MAAALRRGTWVKLTTHTTRYEPGYGNMPGRSVPETRREFVRILTSYETAQGRMEAVVETAQGKQRIVSFDAISNVQDLS